MSALDIGVTKVKQGDETKYFTTMGGAFQIKDNDAIILTTHAENSKDIDVLRAQEAKKRAEARLAQKDKLTDIDRAQVALAKASDDRV